MISIDFKAWDKFGAQLNKLGRTGMPVAIRQTLTGAAFDVKKNTMPDTAKREFTQRKPSFFQANSKAAAATGFDINAMQSAVGFMPKNGNIQQAIEDLAMQERGGQIAGRSFIAMDTARTGRSNKKSVRANARIKAINGGKFASTKDVEGTSEGQRFIKSVYFVGVGGFVLADYNGKRFLWRVNSLNRNSAGGLKLTPLYAYEKDRAVQVDKTDFMREASLKSGDKIAKNYQDNMRKQLEKYLK